MDLTALRARLIAAVTVGITPVACQTKDTGAPNAPPAPPIASEGATEAAAPSPSPAPSLSPSATAATTADASAAPTPSASASAPKTPRCRAGTQRQQLCIDRGSKPGRMVPDVPFTFDANRCVIAAEMVDSCSGITDVLAGPSLAGGKCCYDICRGPIPPCGRPLLVAGAPRVAAVRNGRGWMDVAPSSPRARARHPRAAALAAAWAANGAMEHASVAAFARFALELVAVGAHAELLADAHRAALDEIEHARACFSLAAAYDGELREPAPLSLAGMTVSSDLVDVASRAAEESCVGETFSAIAARRAAEGCADPDIARVLEKIAGDETRHAELGFRFVAWAVVQGGPEVLRGVQAGIARGLASLPQARESIDGDEERALALEGRLGSAALAAVARDARDVVLGVSASLATWRSPAVITKSD